MDKGRWYNWSRIGILIGKIQEYGTRLEDGGEYHINCGDVFLFLEDIESGKIVHRFDDHFCIFRHSRGIYVRVGADGYGSRHLLHYSYPDMVYVLSEELI